MLHSGIHLNALYFTCGVIHDVHASTHTHTCTHIQQFSIFATTCAYWHIFFSLLYMFNMFAFSMVNTLLLTILVNMNTYQTLWCFIWEMKATMKLCHTYSHYGRLWAREHRHTWLAVLRDCSRNWKKRVSQDRQITVGIALLGSESAVS